MVAAAAFLVLLDAAIVSATPTTTRLALAAAVTLLAGFAIIRIWRSNVEIERAATRGSAQKDSRQPKGG